MMNQFSHIFIFAIISVLIMSKTCGQHEALSNNQLAEDMSTSTIGCDSILNESDDQQYFIQKKIENLLRTKRDEPKREINLPPDYSIYKLPKPHSSPMPIFVYLNISKILDWNEFNENIEVDLEMRVMWTDFQILEFNNNTHPGNGIPMIATLTKDEIKAKRKIDNNPGILMSIWKPNLFMVGLLTVSQPLLMSKPLTIRFIPDLGWFEYITRIQVKLDCSMNYQYYPADTQSCFVLVRSFMSITINFIQNITKSILHMRSVSYTKDDVNLTWYQKGVHLSKLDIQNFIARIDEPTHFDIVKNDDEVYDGLGFKIVARRKLSYHLIQTYLASSFYCIIATLSLLIPSSMVEARIGMLMTTLLTLTAMFAAIRSSTPIVSYTKAIDVWMVGCIFFVFLALLQYTFSIWRNMSKSKCYEKQNEKPKWAFKKEAMTSSIHISKPARLPEKMPTFCEAYSFLLFLAIFIIYTSGYWIWLLTASDYFNWNVNSTWNRV